MLSSFIAGLAAFEALIAGAAQSSPEPWASSIRDADLILTMAHGRIVETSS